MTSDEVNIWNKMTDEEYGAEESDSYFDDLMNESDDDEPGVKAVLSVEEIKQLSQPLQIFEIGDRVKAINGSKGNNGSIGEIKEIKNNGSEDFYVVDFGEGKDVLFAENIKLINKRVNAMDLIQQDAVPLVKSSHEDEDELTQYFKSIKKDLLDKE